MGLLFRHHWGWKKIETCIWLFSIIPSTQRNERVKPLATFHGFETKTFLSDHFHVYSALTWRNAKKIDTLVVFIIAQNGTVNYFSCTDKFFFVASLSTTNADDNDNTRYKRWRKAAQNGLKKSDDDDEMNFAIKQIWSCHRLLRTIGIAKNNNFIQVKTAHLLF